MKLFGFCILLIFCKHFYAMSRTEMATRSLNTSTRKKKERAFYETPDVQTSAKIVEEARNSLRTLPTKRPFTPAGDHRKLFGQSGVPGRPPSSFSTIGAQHFSVSRPPTGYRLAPIGTTASTSTSIKVSPQINFFFFIIII